MSRGQPAPERTREIEQARADTRLIVRLGALMLLIYLAHVFHHLGNGTSDELLWMCNVAAALLVIGCITQNDHACAIPLLWLSVGTPLWIIDALAGGEVIPTGILTHFGGLVISALAVRRLGMPRGTWYRAMGLAAAVVAICRLDTPPALNVNLAHAVQRGWESRFESHLRYLGLLFAIGLVTCFVVERLARRLLVRPALR